MQTSNSLSLGLLFLVATPQARAQFTMPAIPLYTTNAFQPFTHGPAFAKSPPPVLPNPTVRLDGQNPWAFTNSDSVAAAWLKQYGNLPDIISRTTTLHPESFSSPPRQDSGERFLGKAAVRTLVWREGSHAPLLSPTATNISQSWIPNVNLDYPLSQHIRDQQRKWTFTPLECAHTEQQFDLSPTPLSYPPWQRQAGFTIGDGRMQFDFGVRRSSEWPVDSNPESFLRIHFRLGGDRSFERSVLNP